MEIILICMHEINTKSNILQFNIRFHSIGTNFRMRTICTDVCQERVFTICGSTYKSQKKTPLILTLREGVDHIYSQNKGCGF